MQIIINPYRISRDKLLKPSDVSLHLTRGEGLEINIALVSSKVRTGVKINGMDLFAAVKTLMHDMFIRGGG